MDPVAAWFEAIDARSSDGVGHAGVIAVTQALQKGNELRLVGFAGNADVNRNGDQVVQGAYARHLKAYLEENPVVLWQHDHDQPIGRAVEARETDMGLHVVDLIPTEGALTEAQVKAVTLIRQGIVKSLSIGAIVHKRDWVSGSEADEKGVEEFRRITEAELIEHSVVTIPANRGTTFQMVASLRKRGFVQVPRQYVAGTATDPAELLETMRALSEQLKDIAASLDGGGEPLDPETEAAQATARALGITG